jgi:hypothetical protein
MSRSNIGRHRFVTLQRHARARAHRGCSVCHGAVNGHPTFPPVGQVGSGWCPSGARSVPHRGRVDTPLGHGRCPLGHDGCPTGTRWVPHWDMVGAPLGHGGYSTGTRWVPVGTRSLPHWDTMGAPLGHGGCPVGVRWVSHWGARSAQPVPSSRRRAPRRSEAQGPVDHAHGGPEP